MEMTSFSLDSIINLTFYVSDTITRLLMLISTRKR